MRAVTIASLLVAAGLASGCSPQGAPVDSKPAAPPAEATPSTAPGTARTPDPLRQPGPGTAPTAARQAPAAPAAPAAQASEAASVAPVESSPRAPQPAQELFREVTIPEGTVLTIVLESSHGSDTSHVEDRVDGRLAAAVVARGVEALSEGANVTGRVIDAKPSGRVKGRASLALRFTEIEGRDGQTAEMRTGSVSRLARSAKRRDAATVGGSAAGGAVVGAIIGGKKGAAVGAVVGGAGGTGVVLATKGEEVRLGAGQTLKVRLTASLTVRVPGSR